MKKLFILVGILFSNIALAEPEPITFKVESNISIIYNDNIMVNISKNGIHKINGLMCAFKFDNLNKNKYGPSTFCKFDDSDIFIGNIALCDNRIPEFEREEYFIINNNENKNILSIKLNCKTTYDRVLSNKVKNI